MTGFAAIAHHNGWIMALTGAVIVFVGLIVLTSAIAQLKKLVRIGTKTTPDEDTNSKNNEQTTKSFNILIPDPFPLKIKDAAIIYQPLVEQLGDNFKLSDLYAACGQAQVPHPHLTISGFRQTGIIVPQANNLFSWNPSPL